MISTASHTVASMTTGLIITCRSHLLESLKFAPFIDIAQPSIFIPHGQTAKRQRACHASYGTCVSFFNGIVAHAFMPFLTAGG